ncbi:acetoacetate decarboxylase family protein [Streptomyces sp. NPDC017940]|uniref:acetoacetate decarboxylase family protein n=1 Tax=Streptomyces sp. NPDC017940 TaxID=3365017 RepID=UPI00379E256E
MTIAPNGQQTAAAARRPEATPPTAGLATAPDGPTGYTLPLSPDGRSSLVPSPPWHFSGDVLYVAFRTDPEVVRAFLPPALRQGEIDGTAAAVFGDWQSCCDDGAELEDPVRAQFREFSLFVACTWRGRPAVRCPLAWVDADFSLVRGLVQGYPKKLGDIAMTRSFGIGRAGAPLAAGTALAGTLAAGHRRLAEARVVLDRPADLPPLMTHPMVHTRRFPAWTPDGPGETELVTGGSTDQTYADVWAGRAELAFFDSPVGDLAAFAPREVLGGYRFSFAETLLGGERAEA